MVFKLGSLVRKLATSYRTLPISLTSIPFLFDSLSKLKISTLTFPLKDLLVLSGNDGRQNYWKHLD